MFLTAFDLSEVHLINSIICDCDSKISTVEIMNSALVVFNSSFINLTGLSVTGGIRIYDNSQLSLEKTFFLQNYGGLASNLVINNCQFIELINVSIIFKHNMIVMNVAKSFITMNMVNITGSPLFSKKLLPSSIINLINLYGLDLRSTSFKNLHSSFSPITIQFDSSNIEGGMRYDNSNITIISTDFFNCSSQTDGGALYLNHYFNITITDCIFIANLAVNSGGAILYESSDLTHVLTITNSIFLGNFAGNEGGCIKYNTYAPKLFNNVYANNFAYYGNILAGFITKAIIVEILSEEAWINVYDGDYRKIYLNYFCSYLDSIDCNRSDETHVNYNESFQRYVSLLDINTYRSVIVKDKIVVLLLDDNNQIVSTQYALCDVNKAETKLMGYDNVDNTFYFIDSIEFEKNYNNYLSRLQVFNSKEGVIVMSNFQVDYAPGKMEIYL